MPKGDVRRGGSRHSSLGIPSSFGIRHSSFLLSFGLFLCAAAPARATTTNDPWTIDFRYAPPWWQTAICLPDDWQKTLVGKEGSLLYDYPGSYAGLRHSDHLRLGARGSLA